MHKKHIVKILEAKINRTARRVDESTIIVGDFNTPLSKMNKSSRQKISKDVVELNNTINKLDIIDIY